MCWFHWLPFNICSPFLKRNNYISKPPFPVQSAASFHINTICMRHLLLPFNNLNLHFLFIQLSDSFPYHISIFNSQFARLLSLFQQEIDFPSNLTTSREQLAVRTSLTLVSVSRGAELCLGGRQRCWPGLAAPMAKPVPSSPACGNHVKTMSSPWIWRENPVVISPGWGQGTASGFCSNICCGLAALPSLIAQCN